MSVPAQRRVQGPPANVLAATLGIPRTGIEPTQRLDRSGAWRATYTSDGPVTVRFAPDGDAVQVSAWGPGAESVLDEAPAWLGAHDDPTGFEPRGPLLTEIHRRFHAHRMGRPGRIWESIAPWILAQKVPGASAARSWRSIVRTWGEPAPGPIDLLLPPRPERIAALAYYHLHDHDVERTRALRLIAAARRAMRLEEAAAMTRDAAAARLQALPGIGPWTAARVMGEALGDPDAVPLGDYNLPSFVAWNLAGERTADEARMLELLEPFRGHRLRAIALLSLGGSRPPRRGPRLDLPDLRGR